MDRFLQHIVKTLFLIWDIACDIEQIEVGRVVDHKMKRIIRNDKRLEPYSFETIQISTLVAVAIRFVAF